MINGADGMYERQARCQARDYERLVQHGKALITSGAITLMTRLIARKKTSPSGLTKDA